MSEMIDQAHVLAVNLWDEMSETGRVRALAILAMVALCALGLFFYAFPDVLSYLMYIAVVYGVYKTLFLAISFHRGTDDEGRP